MRAPDAPAAQSGTPWQRALAGLADGLRAHLPTQPPGRPARTLWWGAGWSDLMADAALDAGGELLLADTEPRRLRRGSALAGAAARTLRLLALADLRRDAEALALALRGAHLRDVEGYLAFEEQLRHQSAKQPAVADGWADRSVLDFALNRVADEDEAALLAEALRTLAPTGSVLAATLVCDEPLPGAHAVRDAPAGPALRLPTETGVLQAFANAGFHGIALHWCARENPPAIDRIGGADVRMCIVQAHKGKHGPCLDLGQAVVYGGPWREVADDDGHVYRRGERVAVCAKTYALMMRAPYAGAMVGLRSAGEPALAQAAPFDCHTPALRDPRVTKGLLAVDGTRVADPAPCGPGSGCC